MMDVYKLTFNYHLDTFSFSYKINLWTWRNSNSKGDWVLKVFSQDNFMCFYINAIFFQGVTFFLRFSDNIFDSLSVMIIIISYFCTKGFIKELKGFSNHQTRFKVSWGVYVIENAILFTKMRHSFLSNRNVGMVSLQALGNQRNFMA